MVKVGVVGCGYWGSKYLRVLNETAEGKVAGIYDLDPDRLAQASIACPGVLATCDYDRLLDSDIEAVVIATPAATHFSLAKEALLRGKHVLVEKPFATTTSDAMELLQLADQQKLALMVGSTFLYSPPVRLLKEVIDNGELGSILYIHSSRLNFGLLRPDVDVLWDLAPHDIAIILHLLGQIPLAVAARGVGCVNGHLSEIAHADLAFPDGLLAHIHVSWLEPTKIRRLTVVGSKRMAVYDDTAAGEAIRIYDREVKFSSKNDINGNGSSPHHNVSYSYGDIRIPYIPGGEPLKEECEHFLHCIQSGQQPLSDGWHGLQVVRILETFDKSLDAGGAMEQFTLPYYIQAEQLESLSTIITTGE